MRTLRKRIFHKYSHERSSEELCSTYIEIVDTNRKIFLKDSKGKLNINIHEDKKFKATAKQGEIMSNEVRGGVPLQRLGSLRLKKIKEETH